DAFSTEPSFQRTTQPRAIEYSRASTPVALAKGLVLEWVRLGRFPIIVSHHTPPDLCRPPITGAVRDRGRVGEHTCPRLLLAASLTRWWPFLSVLAFFGVNRFV